MKSPGVCCQCLFIVCIQSIVLYTLLRVGLGQGEFVLLLWLMVTSLPDTVVNSSTIIQYGRLELDPLPYW